MLDHNDKLSEEVTKVRLHLIGENVRRDDLGEIAGAPSPDVLLCCCCCCCCCPDDDDEVLQI